MKLPNYIIGWRHNSVGFKFTLNVSGYGMMFVTLVVLL